MRSGKSGKWEMEVWGSQRGVGLSHDLPVSDEIMHKKVKGKAGRKTEPN